ncbi:hypothetical protein F4824DRAFT_467460 [Ustulina deusta]|nr:hypothetical protein F4824DRAFT_467460 [Ustulina deusta]
MTLPAAAIIGIVGLLLTSIPGVRYILRVIRRRLHSRRKRPFNSDTVLPLSDDSLPNFGQPGGGRLYIQAASTTPIDTFVMNRQTMRGELSDDPIVPGLPGFVAISMSAAMFWPAVDSRPCPSGRSISRTQYSRE